MNTSETRKFVDEVRGLEKNWMLDLGHPLLNRVADSFVKAAGIGAIQAVTRDSYFMAIEGESGVTGSVSDATGTRKRTFPDLKGSNNSKSAEAMVKGVSKESFQWGLAAGMHSGLTYGLTEVRGTHDWKNSAVAGAVTGAALALTSDNASHEQVVQCAITGAALSAAANVLSDVL
ncbi:outer envelope pore protein 16-2, chloroplastic-like [Lolium rigidum]|uniref:outer envelope pore protein 16-2, chloroplastic-like n=1 Tax=Lolium rigidum TaxID=89674 RepID=UPI001F5DA1FB|nr:outer envelope pore protein 16-2, chloroplastic-like [Lolium rigidum]